MTPADLNSLFDKAVLNDTTVHAVKTTEFPPSEIIQKPSAAPLRYTKAQKLWDNNLKAILGNDRYPEAVKIQFIKDALADTSHDAFEYINSRAIDFWRASPEATSLIEQYFKQKGFEHSENKNEKYKYLEFRTKSRYPDAYDLCSA